MLQHHSNKGKGRGWGRGYARPELNTLNLAFLKIAISTTSLISLFIFNSVQKTTEYGKLK